MSTVHYARLCLQFFGPVTNSPRRLFAQAASLRELLHQMRMGVVWTSCYARQAASCSHLHVVHWLDTGEIHVPTLGTAFQELLHAMFTER